jgi:putative oxidoreductase
MPAQVGERLGALVSCTIRGVSASIDQKTAPYAALLLRLTLGALFIAHLFWKFALLDGGINRWWGSFAVNGYPWFVPYYVFSAEIVGAVCLVPGIYARWAALYALPMMVGAANFWLQRKGFYFTAAGGELPLVWGAMLIMQALIGDGPWAMRASTFSLPQILRRRSAQ